MMVERLHCVFSVQLMLVLRSDKELEELCDLSVRGLEELIDYQEYPVKAAETVSYTHLTLPTKA